MKWREGSADWLSSHFARARRCRAQQTDPQEAVARVAADRVASGQSRTGQILVVDASGKHQVARARRLRQAALAHRGGLSGTQAGGWLGHYEGRGWRGFHNHATLCIAAYEFLISERERIPPSGLRRTALFKAPALPQRYRPRGSPLRPERHIPNSIATMRIRLINALIKNLPRCPCCGSNAAATYRQQKS